MFCPGCGAEIADDAQFCTNCGARLGAETIINDVEVVNNDSSSKNSFNNTGNVGNDVVPFVNDVETIENDDFDDGQTEIIFDKKLPTDRLKKGNKSQIAIIAIGMILVIGIAVAAILITNNSNKKKIAEMQKTGIETTENGKIMYNKGNNVYAYDELIDEGSSTYYFDKNGEMVKGEWIENKGKWYYCENDGKIAKSKWLESTYYVNEYGEMLKNTTTPDGYFVDAEGKYVDQAALLAAQQTQPPQNQGGGGGNSGNGNNTYKVEPSVPKVGKSISNIDYSKEVYIVGYDRYQSYTYYDDETSVDIIIDYPIFGGQNQEEVALMNTAMQNCLQNDLEPYIETDINNKTDETKPPRRVNISEASVASIESNKIYVIMKGNMERKSGASIKLNYRFIYERDTGSAYVKD